MSLLLLFNQETEADIDDFIDVGHLQVENFLSGSFYLKSPQIKDHLIDIPIKAISFISLEVVLKQNTGQLELSLPLIICDINTSSGLELSLPKFNFTSNLFPGRAINSQIHFPNFLIDLSAGSVIQAELENFTCTIQTNYNSPASYDFYIPSFELFLICRADPLIDINISIPQLNILLDSDHNSSTLNCLLRPFFLTGDILSGNTFEFDGYLPLYKSRIESKHSGANDFLMALSSIQLQIKSGDILSNVLRYIRKRLR